MLGRSAGSIPIRAPSAPESRFSAISPPLGVVSSRGLRPAIALSREGLARVRVRPRDGRRAALARWQGRVSAVSHTHPNHSALTLFFCDFTAARPRFVARLERSDSTQSRRPSPRGVPSSPRPSRSARELARSRLRSLPHAPQSQPCFFTTTSPLGSSYSPAVTLFFFGLKVWFSTVMVLVLLLLLPATPAHNISTEAERDAWDVYCCCCSWLLLFLSFTLRCFGYGC